MYNGVIVVDKEAGFSSHDVVAKLRGILGQKKIGHTGTLDPAALGVLPVCLGSATKLVESFSADDKEYLATLRLGITSDTQDIGGQIIRDSARTVDAETLRGAILSFLGSYAQIPPMYSAIKHQGRRLYEIARGGQEVERSARMVEIKELEITRISWPEASFRVVCSKGTYIRTLCHDIGEKLGCGGVMAQLTRTRSGCFHIEAAHKLGEIEALKNSGGLDGHIMGIDSFFPALKRLSVTTDGLRLLKNGNRLKMDDVVGASKFSPDEQVLLYGNDAQLYGLYEYDAELALLKAQKMFLCK